MKKLLLLIFVLLCFTACGGTSETVETTTQEPQTTTEPSITTSENPAPTTTKVKIESTEFAAVCEFEEISLTLFCKTNSSKLNALSKWTSNATSRWGTSPEWEFILGDQGAPIPETTFIEIEECVGTVCRTAQLEIDTSTYSSDNSTSSESGVSSFEESPTDNSLFHAGRLVQLPIDPYELVATEAVERFRGYGSSSQTSDSDAPLSNQWEFIGAPGVSVYAPLSGTIVKVD